MEKFGLWKGFHQLLIKSLEHLIDLLTTRTELFCRPSMSELFELLMLQQPPSVSKRCKLRDDLQNSSSSMLHKLARFLMRESVAPAEIRMRPVCKVVFHIQHELPDLEPAQYVDPAS